MEAPYVIPNAIMDESFTGNYSSIFSTGSAFPENFSTKPENMDLCDGMNPLFNCSIEEYLQYILGPQRLDLTVAVPITVVYVLIFVTGVVGNVSVCVVIVKNQSMHTATNYYLFSLAISDLMLLLLGKLLFM